MKTRDLVAVIVHVQNEILPHHRQADQTDIASSPLPLFLLVVRNASHHPRKWFYHNATRERYHCGAWNQASSGARGRCSRPRGHRHHPMRVSTLRLSVLDQSPVAAGSTPAQALRNSIGLAQHVESLGFRRFWMSEHHAMDLLACTAPEIMLARIGAETTHIRLGSGGVMLPHIHVIEGGRDVPHAACAISGTHRSRDWPGAWRWADRGGGAAAQSRYAAGG